MFIGNINFISIIMFYNQFYMIFFENISLSILKAFYL